MITHRAVVSTLCCTLLLLAGCSSESSPAPATAPRADSPSGIASPNSAPSSDSPPAPLDLEALVTGGDAVLSHTKVTRDKQDYEVASVWIARRTRVRQTYILVTEGTGRTTTYERVMWKEARKALYSTPRGAPDLGSCASLIGGVDLCTSQRPAELSWTEDHGATWRRHPSALEGLLLDPVESLDPGTLAVIGGGDGATLFPLDRFERSLDGGDTWSSQDFAAFDGARAYVNGGVVLGDGRLLAVLGNFSDDRPNRPADRVHGLYVSNGQDWTDLAPLRATFDPPLPDTGVASAIESVSGSVAPDPVVWVETFEGPIYVSTDDAATFTRLDLPG